MSTAENKELVQHRRETVSGKPKPNAVIALLAQRESLTTAVDSWIRRHPVWAGIFLVGGASAAAWLLPDLVSHDETLNMEIKKGVITLVFVALVGGVLKILLEGYELNRQQRESDAAFVTNLIGDLKETCDCVARSRTLMAAHRSVTTYGDEMVRLIYHREQLSAVVRALDTRPDTLQDGPREQIMRYANQMSSYLTSLIDEFRDHYRNLLDCERTLEGQLREGLKDPRQASSVATLMADELKLWDELARLPHLSEFISVSCSSTYETSFMKPLHQATYHLRAEVARITNGKKVDWRANPEPTYDTQPCGADPAGHQSLPAGPAVKPATNGYRVAPEKLAGD